MFSLVVATKDRTADLKNFLVSLTNSTYTDFEVILVDQSEDSIAENNRLLVKDYAFVKYVKDDCRGLSRARNIGLKYVHGDIIAFPDDDCEYPVHLLSLVFNILKNEKYPILLGTYVDKKNGDRAINIGERVLTYNHPDVSGVCSVGIFINTKIISKKSISFDENIGVGTDLPGGEDTELLIRLLREKNRALFLPTVYVFHPVSRENTQPAISMLRHMAKGYVQAKHIGYLPIFKQLFLGIIKDSFNVLLFRKHILYRIKGIYLAFDKKKKVR